MGNVVSFTKGVHPDDEPPRIDVYGQVVMIGVFSLGSRWGFRTHKGQQIVTP